MLTMVSWNVDGLRSHARVREVVLGCIPDPDVVCLQEVRIRDTDRPAIAEAAATFGDAYEMHASLNHDPHNGRFRGGRTYGVMTFVKRTLGASVEPRLPWDREGRLVRVRLPSGLVVANVYAVNGTWRPHHDERGTPVGTRHDWKRELVRLLAETLLPDAENLVAIGDWNVSQTELDTHPRLRTEEPHGLARRAFAEDLVGGLRLVDAYRVLHPAARQYTWFDRRADRSGQLDAARVDFALVSQPLAPRVRAAEIFDASALRDTSDHAPLSLVLDLS